MASVSYSHISQPEHRHDCSNSSPVLNGGAGHRTGGGGVGLSWKVEGGANGQYLGLGSWAKSQPLGYYLQNFAISSTSTLIYIFSLNQLIFKLNSFQRKLDVTMINGT